MTALGRQGAVSLTLSAAFLAGCTVLLTGCAGEKADQARDYGGEAVVADEFIDGEYVEEPLEDAIAPSNAAANPTRTDDVYTADLESSRVAVEPAYSLPVVVPAAPLESEAAGGATLDQTPQSPSDVNPLRAYALRPEAASLRRSRSRPASTAMAATDQSVELADSTPQRFETVSPVPSLEADASAVRSAEIEEEIAAVRKSAPVQLASAASRQKTQPDYVTVFFATDREATADLLPGPVRLFGPAAVACIIFCVLAIATMLVRRLRFLWGLGAFCAAGMGILVCHTTWVRWQQLDRLATDASLAFAPSRFEADAGRYPLHVGRASLSIPPNHQKGKIESVSILRGELTESPDRHIVLQNVRIEEDDTWFSEIADRTSTSTGDRPLTDGNGVFVFIHGYNVRFDDALKRTAQLSTDLGVKGPAICYSWPSRGQLAGYTADESTVAWSAPHLEQLVNDLRERSGVKSINIVAHSMGNRALLQAVERIGIRLEGVARAAQQLDPTSEFTPPKVIDHLVMAAPDVDVETFTSRYVDHLNRVARRRTLYFSAGDRALWVSQFLHGGQRVGLTGAFASLRGIDAIDIGEQSFFSLGHSYYGSEPAVIDDLAAVLLDDKQPSGRAWLQQETASANEYWTLDRLRHAKLTSGRSIQR